MTPMIPKISVSPLATRNNNNPYWTPLSNWIKKMYGSIRRETRRERMNLAQRRIRLRRNWCACTNTQDSVDYECSRTTSPQQTDAVTTAFRRNQFKLVTSCTRAPGLRGLSRQRRPPCYHHFQRDADRSPGSDYALSTLSIDHEGCR